MYVTIQGWGPPSDPRRRNYASQGVWMPNGSIIGPGAIAKVESIPENLRDVLREVTEAEVQEYVDAGHEISDGFMETRESGMRKQIRLTVQARVRRAMEAKRIQDEADEKLEGVGA